MGEKHTKTLLALVDECIENELLLENLWKINKIGGRPAFSPNVDNSLLHRFLMNELRCDSCSRKLIFVLQIYCPLLDISYDRVLYIFACNEVTCKKKNWTVLRCVSPVKPNLNTRETVDINEWSSERDEWQESSTESSCGAQDNPNSVFIEDEEFMFFKPFHVNVENESDFIEEKSKYEQHMIQSLTVPECCANESFHDEKYEKTDKSVYGDVVSYAFYKRLSLCPQQLLRYCFRGVPLFSRSGVETNVDKCVCGAERKFELQVMPALINFLKPFEGSCELEFSTVLIYCCRDDCKGSALSVECSVLFEDDLQCVSTSRTQLITQSQ